MVALIIRAHATEYFCPNLDYFYLLFSNYFPHCTFKQLGSFRQTIITQTNTCTLSSKWHYISVTAACVSLKPQFFVDSQTSHWTFTLILFCWSPVSPSLSLWEHKQTLFLLLSFWEVTRHSTVPLPHKSSHSQFAECWTRGHRAVSWSVMPESQDAEVTCLRSCGWK